MKISVVNALKRWDGRIRPLGWCIQKDGCIDLLVVVVVVFIFRRLAGT